MCWLQGREWFHGHVHLTTTFSVCFPVLFIFFYFFDLSCFVFLVKFVVNACMQVQMELCQCYLLSVHVLFILFRVMIIGSFVEFVFFL